MFSPTIKKNTVILLKHLWWFKFQVCLSIRFSKPALGLTCFCIPRLCWCCTAFQLLGHCAVSAVWWASLYDRLSSSGLRDEATAAASERGLIEVQSNYYNSNWHFSSKTSFLFYVGYKQLVINLDTQVEHLKTIRL